jgi:hypothetical protein
VEFRGSVLLSCNVTRLGLHLCGREAETACACGPQSTAHTPPHTAWAVKPFHAVPLITPTKAQITIYGMGNQARGTILSPAVKSRLKNVNITWFIFADRMKKTKCGRSFQIAQHAARRTHHRMPQRCIPNSRALVIGMLWSTRKRRLHHLILCYHRYTCPLYFLIFVA